MNIEKMISKAFNRHDEPKSENTYKPKHIDDAKRKEWFTTYNQDLVNRIRAIKLNTL